jgi:hypothetical protein
MSVTDMVTAVACRFHIALKLASREHRMWTQPPTHTWMQHMAANVLRLNHTTALLLSSCRATPSPDIERHQVVGCPPLLHYKGLG